MKKHVINWRAAGTPFRSGANLCVGSGHAALGLRRDFQEHLAEAVRECGFRHIRFHGVLWDDMGVYRADSSHPPRHNFLMVDKLYDALLEIGIKPYVELSFMPTALASDPDKTVFWWKANISPPKDFTAWAELVGRFTAHLVDRYGIDEVSRWFFEVWNEPDHPSFWSGTKDEYFRLYEVSARAVKSVDPRLRVGGPATCCPRWHDDFLAFCSERDLPLDFFSTHTYGVKGHLDEFGRQQLRLLPFEEALNETMRRSREQVSASSYASVPIHYNEWGASYSSRDRVHDSYVQAPYLLKKIKENRGHVDLFSYWTFSDIFEEAGPAPEVFHGGFGLMNIHGLKKPSYFAHKYLNKLGPAELPCDDPDMLVCRDDTGLQILAWNYTHPKTCEYNNDYFGRDVPSAAADSPDILLEHVPPGRYRIRQYRTGWGHNDVFTAYLKMGSPEHPSTDQLAALHACANDAPVLEESVVVDEAGRMVLPLSLRENDVVLTEILPASEALAAVRKLSLPAGAHLVVS